MIFNLQLMVYLYINHYPKVFEVPYVFQFLVVQLICFSEYEKVFDSVEHNKLVDQLRKIGLESRDINFIITLYWRQTARLKYDNDMTDEIPIKIGVRPIFKC